MLQVLRKKIGLCEKLIDRHHSNTTIAFPRVFFPLSNHSCVSSGCVRWLSAWRYSILHYRITGFNNFTHQFPQFRCRSTLLRCPRFFFFQLRAKQARRGKKMKCYFQVGNRSSRKGNIQQGKMTMLRTKTKTQIQRRIGKGFPSASWISCGLYLLMFFFSQLQLFGHPRIPL